MLRYFVYLFCLPVIMCSSVMSLPEALGQASQVNAYRDGQEIVMTESEKAQLQEKVDLVFQDAILMPALGVSLDEQTKQDMQQGLWLQFEYGDIKVCNELPFDTLLIHVEKDFTGLNVIRGNQGNYWGRCFYLGLKSDMNELYDFLIAFGTENEPEVRQEPVVEEEQIQPVENNKFESLQLDEKTQTRNSVMTMSELLPSVPDNKEGETKKVI